MGVIGGKVLWTLNLKNIVFLEQAIYALLCLVAILFFSGKESLQLLWVIIISTTEAPVKK